MANEKDRITVTHNGLKMEIPADATGFLRKIAEGKAPCAHCEESRLQIAAIQRKCDELTIQRDMAFAKLEQAERQSQQWWRCLLALIVKSPKPAPAIIPEPLPRLPAESQGLSEMERMRLAEFDFDHAFDRAYLDWFFSYRGRPWQEQQVA